jgi:hypothetical protein
MEEMIFESGLLKSPAKYEAEKQVLTLEFNRGGRYNYAEFTPADWADFIAADSKGKHFLRVIKPKFACAKLPPEEMPDVAKTE